MNQANELYTFEHEGTIKSEFVIESINKFIEKKQAIMVDKPLVLILDNARIHHSELFKSQVEFWQEKNLYLFFLPTYSPHLNKIETLWRKTKYECLKPESYSSYQTLKNAVLDIFNQFGYKYKIKFKINNVKINLS